MSSVFNYQWDQGTDLLISMVYKTGTDTATATPVNLTNYSLRMDLRKDDIDGARVATFNSADIPGDTAVDAVGAADNEAVLGADGSIAIRVPRALTLPPSGAVYTQMQTGSYTFYYDIILRNNSDNTQTKIMEGTITVAKTATLWA